MLTALLITITLTILFIASCTDLKTREVPDWISYSLLISALGIRAIYAILQDSTIIIEGLIGLVIYFIVGMIMFYTGQWGGADAKILWGMGAVIGFQLDQDTQLLSFIINMLLAGAVLGIVYAIHLAYKNKRKFTKEFNTISTKQKNAKRAVLVTLIIAVITIALVKQFHLQLLTAFLTLLITTTFYTWMFVKAVENACMYKRIKPKDLTEGDWIVNDIKVKGKYICGPKDLGIEKDQIKKLIKHKVKSVLIKEGIPFIPSFLVGYIITLLFNNWWMMFL